MPKGPKNTIASGMSATAGIGRRNSITTDEASSNVRELPMRKPAVDADHDRERESFEIRVERGADLARQRAVRKLVVEGAERRRGRGDALLVVERADAGFDEQRHEHDEEPARDVHALHGADYRSRSRTEHKCDAEE